MNTARIDIPKADAKGLGIGEAISITLVGTIRALETYDMSVPTDPGKQPKKADPKITVGIDIAKTIIGEKPAKTPKQAFDRAFNKAGKGEE